MDSDHFHHSESNETSPLHASSSTDDTPHAFPLNGDDTEAVIQAIDFGSNDEDSFVDSADENDLSQETSVNMDIHYSL